ncbi:porin [Paraburkholderia elongata]|uniref:Porin n=1 Tax=Paraburkholderia elongata TaxID=2675747 RepID=A0A972NZA9_9BURK|nr:porin [Paraburkholderia elongata]NPT62628.1 porin [Paraburkholderia elongata]
MIRKCIGPAFLSSIVSVPAFSQSSVTLYGVIDAGITYTNNSAGHSLWQTQSSIAQGSRWGLKGTENLGSGVKAIFQLENGLNVFNGKMSQGGLEFGRQAYVGLASQTMGTLTLGRQYDPFVDIIQPLTFNSSGALFSRPSDIDNSNNGFRVNDAVKYVTPTWNGLSVEAMYALGGVAGSFGRNSTISAGASYSNGGLYLGAAYFYAKNPASQFPEGNFQPGAAKPGVSNGLGAFGYVGSPSNMQTFGVGGTYIVGQARIGLDFTNVRFQDSNGLQGNTVRFGNYEVWAQYYVTSATTLGGGYTFTDGKVDFNGAKPKYSQFNLMADYFISKRTDVYLMGIYQKAFGGANADIYQGVAGQQSSTRSQIVGRIGIRHKF